MTKKILFNNFIFNELQEKKIRFFKKSSFTEKNKKCYPDNDFLVQQFIQMNHLIY